MARMPQDEHLDSSLALARDGYTFIQKRCQRFDSDVFEARLLLQRTICMTGEEAARLFYDTDRFQRRNAVPLRMRNTLLGKGSVMGLDGDAHRERKGLLMSLMTTEQIDRLAELTAREWETAILAWQTMKKVTLLDQVHQIHCRAVCAWAGIPLQDKKVKERTGQLVSLVESPGKIGPKHWKGLRARRHLENWCAGLADQVRDGRLRPSQDQALNVIAHHRGANGKLLDRRIVAVEILNLIRPTVAVARYVAFAALALHETPRYRQQIAAGDEESILPFIQEVRRFYAFFPFIAARVRKDFEWKGYHFPKGRRTMLDLFGTNHDPRVWQEPNRFMPERFHNWQGNPFTLIPQGGGDHYTNHRCAGEWVTQSLMGVAIRKLTRDMTYEVPKQDLTIKLYWLPTAPKSHFVIREVKRVAAA